MLAAIALFAAGAVAIGATVTGTPNNDDLNGTPEADTISGGSGDDKINGLAADDTLDGGGDSDTIDGGEGNDTVYGGNCRRGQEQIGRFCDNSGNEHLKGGPGDDELRVNQCALVDCNDDPLLGVDSTLDGGDGNDRLTGLAGNDSLTGGTGQD